jgi:serine/threonine protein kinase
LDKLGEGTYYHPNDCRYGTVYSAKDKLTGQIVAIKKVKIHDTNEGFPITCLREIRILQQLSAHPNIVNLREVAVGPMKESIHLVFEYCAIDLATLIDRMYVGKR